MRCFLICAVRNICNSVWKEAEIHGECSICMANEKLVGLS